MSMLPFVSLEMRASMYCVLSKHPKGLAMRWFVAVIMGLFASAGLLAGESEDPAAKFNVSGAQVVQQPDVLLHVNPRHQQAADANAGHEDSPLRTIQAAATRAFANRSEGKGTKVLIHPGIYREAVQIGSFELSPDAPVIIFEGVDPAQVVIRGSDVLSDWRRESGSDIYHHHWPHRWEAEGVPRGWESVGEHLQNHPILLRREMVFLDGALLRQVMSMEELRAQGETFFVADTEPDEPAALWIHTQPGTDLSSVTVEVAVRPTLLAAYHMANFVVRNLTFEHASTAISWPAVRLDGGRNILMENCRIQWNNWNAMSAYLASNVTWRRLVTSYNGAGGINAWRATNLRVEDCQASHNNWRGAWGDFLGWAQGQKFLSLRRAHFLNYEAIGNQAVGLWFDWDNEDVLVEGANLSENATRGLFLEATQGPLVLRNSRINRNGQDGVFITNAARVTFENNQIIDNARHQIHIPWLASEHIERRVTNYQSGETMGIRTTRPGCCSTARWRSPRSTAPRRPWRPPWPSPRRTRRPSSCATRPSRSSVATATAASTPWSASTATSAGCASAPARSRCRRTTSGRASGGGPHLRGPPGATR
jgi:hypothetical protein